MTRTRDQEYAASALEQIERDIKNMPEAGRKKYGAMAHKLPVLLRTAGLAQSLAFVEARGTREQQLLLNHLAVTLGLKTEDELLQRSRDAKLGLGAYMLLTRRTQAALLWYKRFAQSVLGVEDDDDMDTGDES